MTPSRLLLAGWSMSAFGVVAVVWAVITPIGMPPLRRVPVSRLPETTSPGYPAESLARVVSGRDLFRAVRRPAETAYDPLSAARPVVDAPPKPMLALVGVVAGLEPTAVIEGFPGIEGSRVVRIGDVVAGLRVRSIASTGVHVAGMDTVWTLKVREPWRN